MSLLKNGEKKPKITYNLDKNELFALFSPQTPWDTHNDPMH